MNKRSVLPVTGQTLTGIDIFASVPAEKRTRIATVMQGRAYDAGELVIPQQDSGCDVYFVVSGVVRVTYYSASGKEVAFREMAEGTMFGEISALDGQARSAQVLACSDAFVARLPREQFIEVLSESPELANYVMRHLARLVRLLSNRVVEFSTLGVCNRLHAELLRLAREAATDGKEARIERFPTHADIANRISTHREAVTRELNALTRAGLLRKDSGALIVLDMNKLEAMVRDITGDARPL